jgi:hypothetical protein
MKLHASQILITVLIASVAFFEDASAVNPPPDGGYPNGNTAAGQNALLSLTIGGFNTALGWESLRTLTTGNYNVGVGAGTLALNTADSNTAIGSGALLLNTGGDGNTATGAFALSHNTYGGGNTANGVNALFNTDTAYYNNAFGIAALYSNTGGSFNNAFGGQALFHNIYGSFNIGIGQGALFFNQYGDGNTAVGNMALNYNDFSGKGNAGGNSAFGNLALSSNSEGDSNCGFGSLALQFSETGSQNTAIGYSAGSNLITGDGNVYLGADVFGSSDESDHTYIRNINTTSVNGGGTDTVTVNLTTGLLGHLSSSRRCKEDIKPMDTVSEALFALKPVTYRYKKEIDPSQSPAFGLVAEDVAEVDPALIARNAQGEPESVHYEMVNAMLLNEFLKEHRTVVELKEQIAALTAMVKEQSARVEKVSAEVQLSRSAPQQVVGRNPQKLCSDNKERRLPSRRVAIDD